MNHAKTTATNVDFIHTEVTLGKVDGEVVVKTVAKLQLEKFPVDGLYEIYHKRFPQISRSGAFTTIGHAVCGDEPFDFEKGMRIAETRAQSKAYNVANRVFAMMQEYFDEQAQLFASLKANCKSCMINANAHVLALDLSNEASE